MLIKINEVIINIKSERIKMPKLKSLLKKWYILLMKILIIFIKFKFSK